MKKCIESHSVKRLTNSRRIKPATRTTRSNQDKMKLIKDSRKRNAIALKVMSEQRRNALKYVKRDKHMAFFLPKAAAAKSNPWKKKKKKKPRTMTNKERRIYWQWHDEYNNGSRIKAKQIANSVNARIKIAISEYEPGYFKMKNKSCETTTPTTTTMNNPTTTTTPKKTPTITNKPIPPTDCAPTTVTTSKITAPTVITDYRHSNRNRNNMGNTLHNPTHKHVQQQPRSKIQ